MLQSLGRGNFDVIFMNEFKILIDTMPFSIFISTSLVIFLFGLAFTIFPALIALKKYNLGDIKQKY